VHSVGGIICGRLRASMSASMLRMLIVSHQELRAVLNDSQFMRSLQIVDEEDAACWVEEGEGDLYGAAHAPPEVADMEVGQDMADDDGDDDDDGDGDGAA